MGTTKYAAYADKRCKKAAQHAPMDKRVLIAPAVVALVALVGGVLYLLYGGDPEKRAIRRMIKDVVRAIEQKDAATVLDRLHDTYTDTLDNDYGKVRAEAEREFDGIEDISIRLSRIDVEVERGVGTASFQVKFRAKVRHGGRLIPVSGVRGGLNPLGGSWEDVTLKCIKRGDQWLIRHMAVRTPQRSIPMR